MHKHACVTSKPQTSSAWHDTKRHRCALNAVGGAAQRADDADDVVTRHAQYWYLWH